MRAVLLGSLALATLFLTACEELVPEPLEGGYDMQVLGVHDVELKGAMGPVAELDGSVQATDGVSCPGELYLSFDSDEPEGHARIAIALNQVFPDLAPGELFRVDTDGEDGLFLEASVDDWSAEAIHTELWFQHLGLDVYKAGFVALLDSGDELSGTFTMDRSDSLTGPLGELP